jgi:hypothetical protein
VKCSGCETPPLYLQRQLRTEMVHAALILLHPPNSCVKHYSAAVRPVVLPGLDETTSPFLVVAALFVLSLITYIDRSAISSAKGPIASELSLSDTVMGGVFGALIWVGVQSVVPLPPAPLCYAPVLVIGWTLAGRRPHASHCGELESLGTVFIEKDSPRLRCRNSMLCGRNTR